MAANPGEQRNWKGIGIAMFVIGTILGCVAVAVVALTPEEEEGGTEGRPFSVAHLQDPRFKVARFNGSWISGGYLLSDAT